MNKTKWFIFNSPLCMEVNLLLDYEPTYGVIVGIWLNGGQFCAVKLSDTHSSSISGITIKMFVKNEVSKLSKILILGNMTTPATVLNNQLNYPVYKLFIETEFFS